MKGSIVSQDHCITWDYGMNRKNYKIHTFVGGYVTAFQGRGRSERFVTNIGENMN